MVMVDHGRPPSYPSVVTTITSGNGNATDNNSNNNAISTPSIARNPFTADTDTAPPSTLEAAARLYERGGNAVASLEACQRLWNDQSRAATDHHGGIENKANVFENEFPLSRQHNQAVLEHLSSLRSQRRRIRPRPSSFDDSADTIHNNDWKESDNLAVILSSVLIEQPSSHNEENAAKNTEPTNSKPYSTANAAATVTVNQNEKKNKREKTVDTLVGGYNQLVGMYNICLSHYAEGNYQDALNVLLSPFMAAMRSIDIDADGIKGSGGDGKGEGNRTNTDTIFGENKKTSPISYLAMTTRIAFLVLDCHFSVNAGSGIGLGPIIDKEDTTNGDSNAIITTEDILTWIEKNALALSSKDDNVMDNNFLEQYESIKQDELKFRLHLYRSRMLFLGNNSGESGHRNNDLETRTRLSRKELKNAMDIYQNRLCIAEEGKEQGKKGNSCRQHGGSKGGSGGGGNEGGSHPLALAKGKSYQDVSETTSVTSMAGGSLVTSVSDALWSEGKGGVGVTRAMFEGMPNKNAVQQQQQQTSQLMSTFANVKVKKDTPNLQIRHESVLYLKANLEHLRGNTTKSLKLCAEARSAGKKSRVENSNYEMEKIHGDADTGELKENGYSHDTSVDQGIDGLESSTSCDGETQMAKDYDEAIYYNNLALLHQSAGKIHLSLHYYSYALSYIGQMKLLHKKSSTSDGHHQPTNSQNFWSDGVARPDISAEILYNTSICAFQAQEFNKAYVFMARCVKMSPNVFGKRARCWLRLAQSCIGIYTNLQQKPESNNELIEGSNVTGLGLNYLGSEDDLHNISTHPLQKASFCLYRALRLSSGSFDLDLETSNTNYEVISSLKDGSTDVDIDCFETALISVAYVKLQFNDRAGALKICQFALRPGSDNVDKDPYTFTSLRCREMAEMYYREIVEMQ